MPAPDASFTYAECMSHIVTLIKLFNETLMRKQDITLKYAFDECHTNYHTDASRYWELIDKILD